MGSERNKDISGPGEGNELEPKLCFLSLSPGRVKTLGRFQIPSLLKRQVDLQRLVGNLWL